MKTLTIRDETYKKLLAIKKEGESFSEVIERLLESKRSSIRVFMGKLRDSTVLEEVLAESRAFRESVRLR